MMSTRELISFARGAPSLDIIDVEGLREAAQLAFEKDPGGATAYGTAVGYPPLRKWIAEQHGVDVEQVIVSNGSMQADAFLFETLISPGDSVVVERPTYDRTLLNLRRRKADIHPVELEKDGISTKALAELLDRGVKPKLAHVIPNFQNPAGHTLSADKREELLGLARKHDFLIFEDDPYIKIRFTGDSLPTMLSLDSDQHVVYASSFSKTVCPGVRVGYLIGPHELIERILPLATNTYIAPNMVAQSIVYQFCVSGRMNHSIASVRTALRERCEAICSALSRELPQASFTAPQGGYFLWVDLPDTISVTDLAEEAKKQGVAFVNGTDFLLEGGQHSMRLAYSGVTVDEINEGIRRLGEAARNLQRA